MKTIELTRGYVALIDDEDYDRVSSFGRWQVTVKRGKLYAVRIVGRMKNKVRSSATTSMHRFIMNARPSDQEVDHIDGDGLNNTKANLRFASRIENCRNLPRARLNNRSGFRGVSWHKKAGKWMTYGKYDGKGVYLGLHESPESAARAFDEFARTHYGEFAGELNFPIQTQPETA